MRPHTLSGMLDQDTNSLNVVRLFLAISVLYSHAFTLSSGTAVPDPFVAWTGYKLGDHAVNVFFVLSGILTAASLDRTRSLTRFIAARALRIFPAVAVVALLIALLLAPTMTTLPMARYFTSLDVPIYVVRTVLFAPGHPLLPGVFEANPVPGLTNEPLWTIKYELICYTLLAAAGAMLSWANTTVWRMIAATLVIVSLVTLIVAPPDLATAVGRFRHLTFAYVLGVAAYFWARQLPVSGLGVAALGALVVLLHGTAVYTPAVVALTGYLALWAGNFRYGVARDWANKTDLSYGVYILHWPVGQVLVFALPGIGIFDLGLTCLAITIALAWLSWTFIEAPALRLKPKQPLRLGWRRQSLPDAPPTTQA
jgi:peptidoglycan/LPS O-acetylase OafA/YrhL